MKQLITVAALALVAVTSYATTMTFSGVITGVGFDDGPWPGYFSDQMHVKVGDQFSGQLDFSWKPWFNYPYTWELRVHAGNDWFGSSTGSTYGQWFAPDLRSFYIYPVTPPWGGSDGDIYLTPTGFSASVVDLFTSYGDDHLHPYAYIAGTVLKQNVPESGSTLTLLAMALTVLLAAGLQKVSAAVELKKAAPTQVADNR